MLRLRKAKSALTHKEQHSAVQRKLITTAGETTFTVTGNLTADPELRFTPSGSAAANFSIASTPPRTFDRQANQWKDRDTLFLRCSLWREAAENVAESLTKGTRVIARGELKPRSQETKEGTKRNVMEFEVEEIGLSLRYATVKSSRANKPAPAAAKESEPVAGEAWASWSQ